MRERKHIRLLALILALILALSLVFAVPVAAAGEDVVIVLDPGHGGMDGGTAMRYDGVQVRESDINLAIAKYCRDYLLKNYGNVRVYLTRDTDKKVSLDERVEFAERVNADYMLSIHINSDKGTARGALAIVPRGIYQPQQGVASKRTAEAILKHLVKLGMKNLGTTNRLGTDRYPDGTYVDYFAVIRGCVKKNIPCIIMEHGFLDNEKDYRSFLGTPAKLRALGEADAQGLAETLGLKPKVIGMPFVDVAKGAWYWEDVCYVWELGLVQGVSSTEYAPESPATRAMVVTLLYRMDGAEVEPKKSSFRDVSPGNWYYAPVEWALENGVTAGISETEFAPDQNVTREQFVTFLHRYAGEPAAGKKGSFSDWSKISGYARNAMSWATEVGLLVGYEDGTVRPRRELSRAELAVLMHRFHLWLLRDSGELVYEWTQSAAEKELYVGESFELTLVNQYGEKADVRWEADCEGVVQVNGTTVTAVGAGTVILFCEVDGEWYECYVEVTEKKATCSISHTDVTIKVGETFRLRLRSSEGETVSVSWKASKSGYVSISGNSITGKKVGTVTVSCTYEGVTYKCIVRVKNA